MVRLVSLVQLVRLATAARPPMLTLLVITRTSETPFTKTFCERLKAMSDSPGPGITSSFFYVSVARCCN